MSEAAATPLYDDRIDTETSIGSGTALVLLWRSLKLLSSAKDLFIGKAFLAILSIVPPLIIPWLVKIVVDQVILQQPFGTTDVRFPPFMDPVVAFLRQGAAGDHGLDRGRLRSARHWFWYSRSAD